jgi:poly-gamma-glutamate synthase PgsB/CapB
LIFPDGSEEPVHRKFGIANVAEQIGIVAQAAYESPDALVIECMAIQPDLQEINQTKLVMSTIGVISNVREDHLQEMGPTLENVARSLSRSMPVGGVCVTSEEERLGILAEEAARRNCRLVVVDPDSVTDAEMDGFDRFGFKENVAVALAVAAELGLSRDDALAGMWAAAPDPGELTVQSYYLGSATLKLANVFAANDPDSTRRNIERLLVTGDLAAPLWALINCRPDRIERNRQMGALIPALQAERVFLIGHPTRTASSAIPSTWPGNVVDLGGDVSGEDIFRAIMREVDGAVSVVAIGNIHGQGELFLEHLERLGDLR